MTNPIENLKKAHQAQAITRDNYSLQDYVSNFENQEGKARMELVGIEAKYIPQYDADNPQAKPGATGNGYRTRFILKDGTTVGTFSRGAYEFFRFFAQLMQKDGSEPFLHIDIDGVINVDVMKIKLEDMKTTYQFEIVEEGSDLKGFKEFLPNVQNIGLPEPEEQKFDPETGEIQE